MRASRALGLLLGVAADAVFADPRRWHPVGGFGRVALAAERLLYTDRRFAGAVHTAGLVTGVLLLGAGVERVTARNMVARVVLTAASTWAVLGGASLARAGTAMADRLGAGELPAARRLLPTLCGRDPAGLDRAALARAGVESVAENTSDAVVAPLLWGALAGVPGLLGYRAINTLDAMVGYRSPRYRRFGWAAARLDDLVNLLPSRFAAALVVGCAPAVRGTRVGAWRAWRRDAATHPSPNAGQLEAAFAGALRVRLGGRTVYSHGAELRPVLGAGPDPGPNELLLAVALSRAVTAAAAAGSALAAVALHRDRPRRRVGRTGAR